jgi:hypothetical protein
VTTLHLICEPPTGLVDRLKIVLDENETLALFYCLYWWNFNRRIHTNTNTTHGRHHDTHGWHRRAFDAHITRLQAAALGATRKFAVLLDMTNKLLNLVSTVDQMQTSRGKGKAKLENQDDVVDNFHSLVVDSMDQLLEKTVRRFRVTSWNF